VVAVRSTSRCLQCSPLAPLPRIGIANVARRCLWPPPASIRSSGRPLPRLRFAWWKANPPINLPQPPLAVLIVGVFTASPLCTHAHLRHRRAVRVSRNRCSSSGAAARWRYVIFGLRRGLVPLCLLVTLSASRSPPSGIQWGFMNAENADGRLKSSCSIESLTDFSRLRCLAVLSMILDKSGEASWRDQHR